MRMLLWMAMLGVGAGAGGGETGSPATALAVVEPTFDEPQVAIATSNPPQFEIAFAREMPSTGWSCKVDGLEVSAETAASAGRIVARITEVGPAGLSPQVITSTLCRLPLGRLERGVYVLELWVRRGSGDERYGLAQALALRAR